MFPRFYVPGAIGPGQLVALSDEEAQHLARVLRVRPGARVRVFDGRGREFQAVVEEIGRDAVLVTLEREDAPAAPEPRVSVTLVQAVLKGDKMDDVVRDAVMMGVATVQPVVAERSEVALAALVRSHRQERWQKIAVAAAKQCGRATVPEVLPPCAFARIPPTLASIDVPGPALMLVEPGADVLALSLYEIDSEPPSQAMVLVGPEGGWAPDEIAGAGVACHFLTLGGRTLRADAMAVVALSALFTVWREF